MARKPNIHTTFNKQASNWRNVSEGARRPGKTYSTKREAQAVGREMAVKRGVEHLIHNRGGEISARNSYGRDPKDIRG